MQLINTADGADVDVTQVGVHLFKRVRFGDNLLLEKCIAAQPNASWQVIGGVQTLDYSEAALWASATAFGGENLTGEMMWRLRPTPTKMEESLAAAVAMLPTLAAKVTLGKWLEALRIAADKLDAPNRAAKLVWSRGNLLSLPAPEQINMTNADGFDIMTETPGANVGDPPARTAVPDPSGWEYGPRWIQLVGIDDVWEKGTRNLLRVGMLWYTVAGDATPRNQTKLGPLGVLAGKAADILGISTADATKYPEDAAATFAAAASSGKVSIAWAVYKTQGAQRRLTKLQEFRCEDAGGRGAAEHKIAYERLGECVGWWSVLRTAVKSETALDRVPEHILNLMHATGAGDQLGVYALDRLDTAVGHFSHYLELEEVIDLPAFERCDKLAVKLRASAKPGLGGGGHLPTLTALGQQDLSHAAQGSSRRTAGGVPRDLIVQAASEDRKWVLASQAAHRLYLAGDTSGALQALFTGEISTEPNLGPSALARMLLFGKVRTSDLGDSSFSWIDDIKPKVPDYIGERVMHGFIQDGDLAPEDRCTLHLNDFWDAVQLKGSEWGDKMDLEKCILGALLSAVDGSTYAAVPAAERYKDVWRNIQLARPVGAAFAALGMAKDGDGTVRHTFTSSNQTVALYGKDGGDVAARLATAQSTLIKGSLTELGEAFDLSLGANPMYEINRAPLRSATESKARIVWGRARKDFREQAQKIRTGHASGGDSSGPKQLPTLTTIAGKAAATKQTPAEAEAAKAADKAAHLEAQRAGEERKRESLRRATDMGVRTQMAGTDERILFDSVEYSSEKCEAAAAGVCLRFAIGKRRNTHKPLCDGASCGKSHNIPDAFKLQSCRAEPPFAMAIAGKGGGKGGKGGGKGSGKAGGKRARGQ